VFGITTETSLTLVFYFLFSAIYAVVGGTELFMDLALKLVGRRPGGAAKAEVVSSALFGTVSGSAVANVTATGSFTIPLMMRTGYSREWAAAHEAIASTGGQLMPPVMGIAAFVMADILGVPYAIALAAAIPRWSISGSLYLLVTISTRCALGSVCWRLRSMGSRRFCAASADSAADALIGAFASADAPMAAVIGGIVAGHCSIAGGRPMTPRRFLEMTDECASQAASVAIPIAAIGIIIGSQQSNPPSSFEEMLALGGGTPAGSPGVHRARHHRARHGALPTVAAYVIGAILFVPGVAEARRRCARLALLRAVLRRAGDGDATGRARLLHRGRHRPRQSQQDRALRLHPEPADVSDPNRIRARSCDPVRRRLARDSRSCRDHRVGLGGLDRDDLRPYQCAAPRRGAMLFGAVAVVSSRAVWEIGRYVSLGAFALLIAWAMPRFMRSAGPITAGE
jgi:hypothetical protein